MLLTRPLRYLNSLFLLLNDVWRLGVLSRTAMGQVYRFLFSSVLAKQLLANKCSHIHVHFAHVPTDIAMYAANTAKISYSVTSHANDIFERGWLLREKVARSAFFGTISQFNQRYLYSLGVNQQKIKIIRCGVDAEKFSRRDQAGQTDTINLGVVGRLVEKKGIDDLIAAVQLLKADSINVKLHIAGSGPLEKELKDQVKALGLTNNDVAFLGALPHKEISAFLNSLDIFVLPCRKDKNGDMDGIPVVLMEAMLSGVPVISTRISGIPELVVNEETGLCIQANDPKALANAVKHVTQDDDFREKMVVAAIDMVNKEFSLASNVAKLKQLFEQK